MSPLIGVIADDFTGATDIAGFLVAEGLQTIQLNGVPAGDTAFRDADAVVVSLKSRSIPADEAVAMSLAALRFLQQAGVERFYFKYCSTFDSTPAGNIGPVTDALLDALGAEFTIICPSLPVNGRTVYRGYLFVDDVPLNESGMRNHPVTPMTDANLMRVMAAQSRGRAANVPWATVDDGAAAVRAAFAELRDAGVRYAVVDTLADADLDVIGEASLDLPLVTGGSGLGAGLARALTHGRETAPTAGDAWTPLAGRAVVLSGSASVMTNAQVAAYREIAPSFAVEVDRVMADPRSYAAEILAWVVAQGGSAAPLVYATASPDEVRRAQETHGAAATAHGIETLFAQLARALADAGFTRFIVAGGETSGAVTTALGVTGFRVGPQIAPGVPWVRSLDNAIELALKSGNFGAPDFFTLAQQIPA